MLPTEWTSELLLAFLQRPKAAPHGVKLPEDAAANVILNTASGHKRSERVLPELPSLEAARAAILVAEALDDPNFANDVRLLVCESVAFDILQSNLEANIGLLATVIPSIQSQSGRATVDVFDYLTLQDPPKHSLPYVDVMDGRVHMTKAQFVNLVVRRFLGHLEPKTPPTQATKKALAAMFPAATATGKAYVQARRREETATRNLGIEPDSFPPCIKLLLEQAQSSGEMTHYGRLAFISFLYYFRMPEADMRAIFSTRADYDKAKTDYQLKHITTSKKGGYRPMGCQKMKENGLCNAPTCQGPSPTRLYAWNRRSKQSTRTTGRNEMYLERRRGAA